MRECGECTWCCYFTTAPELNKKVNEYCKHCIPDKGCSTYEQRLQVCKVFSCLWLKQQQIPESLRPDRCSVMFELPGYCKTYIAYVDPEKPDSWKQPNVMTLIRKINEAGHAVLININEMNFFLPNGITLEDVKQDILNYVSMYRKEGRI